MTDGSTGLVVLLLIAGATAFLWHHFVRAYVVAVLGATVSAVVLFQAAAFVQLGYLDPFFLIAMATSSVVAGVVSAAIGLPYRARRKKNGTPASAP